jgi:hypothetical protein
MHKISPQNLSAQLHYRARGNPPSAQIAASVGNYYPGLEIDLRNLWRRLLVGIELHEAVAIVTGIEPDAPEALQALAGETLLAVDGHPIVVAVTGPAEVGGEAATLGFWSLEWANAFADILSKAGSTVPCRFSKGDAETQEIALEVRPVFEPGTSLLNRALAQPGELTQSLCSPWQNDFIGCGCYYWAASRPDYVNVEPDGNGGSRGHNWLERGRTSATPLRYTLKSSDLLEHEDIIASWEDKLKFVFGGRDER